MALSQQELNRRCGFGAHQVYRYEAEKAAPSAEHLRIIAEQLDVSTDYLLGLSIDPGGKSGDYDLNEDERDMVEVFRREGWRGVIRLGADRMGGGLVSCPSRKMLFMTSAFIEKLITQLELANYTRVGHKS